MLPRNVAIPLSVDAASYPGRKGFAYRVESELCDLLCPRCEDWTGVVGRDTA
jgi:hypothetical protein